MQITPQSRQYGLPERGVRALPTTEEVEHLMGAPGIPHGTMAPHPSESERNKWGHDH